MFPSWIKSRKERPRLVYFFAIEMTSRRLASTISVLARCLAGILNHLQKLLRFEPQLAVDFLQATVDALGVDRAALPDMGFFRDVEAVEQAAGFADETVEGSKVFFEDLEFEAELFEDRLQLGFVFLVTLQRPVFGGLILRAPVVVPGPIQFLFNLLNRFDR